MKNIRIIFCVIIAVALLCGCSGVRNENSEYEKMGEKYFKNTEISIYDKANAKIGEIEHYGTVVKTNDSIIYMKVSDHTAECIVEMEYYRYVISTRENIKLGTVKKWAYQAGDTVFIGDHLYVILTTGDVLDANARTLRLYDIDLKQNRMTEVFSEQGAFPYASMSATGGKLLLTDIVENATLLKEYDPASKKIETIKKIDFDDHAGVGEAVRQITADENTISLLILKAQVQEHGEKKHELRIDVYDYDMNFQRSIDVSSISSNPNELSQGVAQFEFSDNYIYYENFSTTRFLGKINSDGKLTKVMDTGMDFMKMHENTQNKGVFVFCPTYSKKNSIYRLNTKTEEIQQSEFHADDERYYIINAMKDQNDNLLLVVGYRDPDTGEDLTPKMYYLKLSDLEFADLPT